MRAATTSPACCSTSAPRSSCSSSCAAAAAALAVRTQREPLAMIHSTSLALRLANALTSCVAYLGETFFPVHLGVFYPFPHAIGISRAALALLLLLAISGLAWALARPAPSLAAGCPGYRGTLAPVTGVRRVGEHR